MAVPLWAELSDDVRARMRAALACADRRWRDFAVASKTAYLGCAVGPGAAPDDSWQAPVAKASDHAASMAKRGAARGALVPIYGERVLTVLSYKQQLYRMSWKQGQVERRLLAKLFRLGFSVG